MNLLYLHAHDLGRWIGPCGHAVETPNLAAFAAAPGTAVFRNAHSAAPTCSPSRAALLTGQWPHRTGMLGLMHRGFRLRDPARTLPAFLQSIGFETVLAGIQHLQPGADLRGYDRRLNRVESMTQQGWVDWAAHDRGVAAGAAAYLAKKPKDGPFFLDCGFWFPHRPFPAPDADIDPETAVPPPGIPDTPATRRDMAGFLTAVRHLDRCCGVVLEALESSPHADDTLVIFTTDHGPAFPGYKCNLTASGTGVALMLRIPGRTPARKTIDALVSQVDLFPTLGEALGVGLPDWPLAGRGLAPLLNGGENSIRDEVFAEVTYHAGYEPMRSIRTATHSLVKIFDDDLSPVPANVDDSAAKDALVAGGWLERSREWVRLFDLRDDSAETRNVAEDPGYAAVRKQLEARLEVWMKETGDPLLAGPIAAPPGSYVNDRDHLSPTIGE
ncbi:MAG: sulfatase [Verrucomicrobiae bacterium]|nr:sulfatase [Verrucomicrobiae bacterium]